jgi:hypothetical protein
MTISCSVLLRMRNISDKFRSRNQNTHIMFNNFFFENRVVHVIVWKYTVEPGRPQMTVWRMCIASWICKATSIHSEYVILIVFSTSTLVYECTSTLNVHCMSFHFSLVRKERLKLISYGCTRK